MTRAAANPLHAVPVSDQQRTAHLLVTPLTAGQPVKEQSSLLAQPSWLVQWIRLAHAPISRAQKLSPEVMVTRQLQGAAQTSPHGAAQRPATSLVPGLQTQAPF